MASGRVGASLAPPLFHEDCAGLDIGVGVRETRGDVGREERRQRAAAGRVVPNDGLGPLRGQDKDGADSELVCVGGTSRVRSGTHDADGCGVAMRARQIGRSVSSVVTHSHERGGRKGVRDRGREIASHQYDDVIVERTGRVHQVGRKGGGRVADMKVVFISLDHKEDDERGARGLGGYSVFANCLCGGRSPANDTLQSSVIRHRDSPLRGIREVVGNRCGGHS